MKSLITTGSPIHQTTRLPAALQDAVREVNKMLDGGVIRQGNMVLTSFHGQEKDNSWRFCVDCHKLNDVTCWDAYPPP